jgi:hypothetical protein
MLKLTKYEVLKASILKVSKTLNNKALNEVINNHVNDFDDLNTLMFKYYARLHRMNVIYYDIRYHEDINDLKEDIKSLNGVIYKKLYDYNGFNYEPIKHHNTMCVIETSNGYFNHIQYAFNVYNFIEVNNIEVITS